MHDTIHAVNGMIYALDNYVHYIIFAFVICIS